jgi:hypothetical protein
MENQKYQQKQFEREACSQPSKSVGVAATTCQPRKLRMIRVFLTKLAAGNGKT